MGCNADIPDKCQCIWAAVRKSQSDMLCIEGQMEGLHEHIEKLYDMVNMEDRITASDFLYRLTRLEDRYEGFTKTQHPRLLKERLDKLDKITEELEQKMNVLLLGHHNLKNLLGSLAETRESRRPYKCPACNGRSFCEEGMECNACEGSCIIWG